MRIVSGIQPSGRLHLGNYLGAVSQFLELQATHECLFFVADWHALTSAGSGGLGEQAHLLAADYLALGLDPERAVLFRQSDVPEHLQLAWVLASVAPKGMLERAHSYKDKVARGLPASVGLFTYPILMAADILLYGACEVPVGPDQRQHLEMAEDLATKFNLHYLPHFDANDPHGRRGRKVPGILLPPAAREVGEGAAVVPGLDGRKMSKSYDNTLEIFADERSLRRRIMGMPTDSTPVADPKPPGHPLLCLLEALATPAEAQAIAAAWRAGGTGYGAFKQELVAAFLARFGAARARREAWGQRPDDVEDILAQGARRARALAQPVWEQVAAAVGAGRARRG